MKWLNIKSKIVTGYYQLTYPFKKENIRCLSDVVFREYSYDEELFWKKWNNGWYVNKGNDDRKLYKFDKENIKIGNGELLLNSKPFKDHSGSMIYSKKHFLYGVFRFEISFSCFSSEEFAFWLKSYKTDVIEIDNLEVFMDGNTKHELLFTAHEGTKYGSESTHKFYPSTIRRTTTLSKPAVIDLLWEEDRIVWYVNGIPVKVWYGKTPNVSMGIIINYGKIAEDNYHSFAKVKNILVAKEYSDE